MNQNGVLAMVMRSITLVAAFSIHHSHAAVVAAIANRQRYPHEHIDPKWRTLNGNPPKIIGHRGEPVLMPEHTLGSYEIACIENADYVEPDLVLTKDEHLVCFHDLTLKNGTNVESISALAHLKGLTIDDDWYIPDLTLAQLKMLRVEQKLIGIRPQYFNDLFQIPSFEEFLELIHQMSFKLNKPIGIIPELKSPEVVNKRLGKPNFMEDKALQVLRSYGYPLKSTDCGNCKTKNRKSVPCGPVILQCFNKDALEYLSRKTNTKLMMLVEDDPNLLTIEALNNLSSFIHYYAVWKGILYSGIEAVLKYNQIFYNSTQIKEAGGFIPTENFSSLVHAKGMELGLYTIYDSREPSKRGCEIKCEAENKRKELFYYFGLGVDALFVENIGEALMLRLEYNFEQELKAATAGSASVHSGQHGHRLGKRSQ